MSSAAPGRVGVRDYVKECGLEDYLIPSLGVYDSFDRIDFDKLPECFRPEVLPRFGL
jgi:hypothetical protein